MDSHHRCARRGGDHCGRSASKKWSLVLIAGSVGLAGFVVWVLMLIGGHELSELMSFETDGVTNLFFLVGSALVLTGGWFGARSPSGQPPPAKGHYRPRSV